MIKSNLKSKINKLSKEEMILLIEKLQEKQEIQENFMMNISHDLRSILNIIMSANYMLECIKNRENINCDNKEKEYLNIVKRNTYKMLKLIDNLIDITRLENKYFKINKENIEIVNFIETVMGSIDKYAKQKDITLIFDTNKEECIVGVDPQALDRMCINLISNAIKFSPIGSFIYVTLMIDDKDVKISVADNGLGISKEDQKKIFERFNQGSKKNKHNGSGIGLDLVKSLVKLHDGRITLKSELNKGSNFTIILPNTKLEKEEVKFKDERDRVQLLEIEFSDIYI
ncbi:HAMP domain-containing sensor histidine kinase [Clostridium sp.]|uniref:sensor histidine kinase n=1 Tax=Clostridium sp. TaxID=1506 RepID=UPI002A90A1F7|nr:HAMP domain-containing sensor histidine kinase [Clostridium sp.]MDY6011825.1 HAMP domain-containing sensor histidine kinase [Clostridium sp.]